MFSPSDDDDDAEHLAIIMNEVEFLRHHIANTHCFSEDDLVFASTAFLCAGYILILGKFHNSHDEAFNFIMEGLARINKDMKESNPILSDLPLSRPH